MAPQGAQRRRPATKVLDAGNSHGRLIDTRRLAGLLAYPSANAVRHAYRRGRLPVPLFRIAGRRGLFARINDVKTLLQQGLQQAHTPAPKGASTKEEVG